MLYEKSLIFRGPLKFKRFRDVTSAMVALENRVIYLTSAMVALENLVIYIPSAIVAVENCVIYVASAWLP